MRLASTHILFSIVLTLMSGFSEAQTRRAVPMKRLVNENDVYTFMGKPYTGTSLEQFDNRKIKQELNWKDGKLHGRKTTYFKTGIVQEIFHFNHGQRSDSFLIYDNTGTLREKGYYENNLLNGRYFKYYSNGNLYVLSHYINGDINGLFILFYTNGQIESRAIMKDNQKDGKFDAWYEEGTKRKEAFYKDGRIEGKVVKYYPNGDTALIEHIENDVRVGEYKIWDSVLKKLIKSENYNNGKRDGISITYNQFGDTLLYETYIMDVLDGKYVAYESGAPNNFGNFVDGNKHGNWKEGWVTHYQQREGTYNMGTMVGEWIFYDLEGNKLFCSEFNEEGEVVKTKKYKKKK